MPVFHQASECYVSVTAYDPSLGRMRKKIMLNHVHGKKAQRINLRLSDRYKFYSLKDTGITNMLKTKMDVLSVRDQARHSSIRITDIYTPKDNKGANKEIVRYEGEL